MGRAPKDRIERQFKFEARQDRTVGLIGIIAFVGIGSIVLLMQGAPFGMVAISALIIVGGALGHSAWDRERRRAEAYKRRADELAGLSGEDRR